MSQPLVYYNENDPFAVAWLHSLILHGAIPDGYVDPRPIQEVQPDDLLGFTTCHFFAGIGGWAYALRLAGWSEDRPVWTGSCPCQSFSAAGKQAGFADPRHLWPEWFRLIAQCRPPTIFGEQVESAIRHGWWDLVQRNLEGESYACGMAVLGAHSVWAPHLRQRCFFVGELAHHHQWASAGASLGRRGRGEAGVMAESSSERRDRQHALLQPRGPFQDRVEVTGGGEASLMALPLSPRRPEGWPLAGDGSPAGRPWLGHPDQAGPQGRGFGRDGGGELAAGAAGLGSMLADPGGAGGQQVPRGTPRDEAPDEGAGWDGRTPYRDYLAAGDGENFWSPADWLHCRDGVSRPVEPGTFPLAHGLPARVGSLRGYGNAIVPQVAAAFIEAYMEDLRGVGV